MSTDLYALDDTNSHLFDLFSAYDETTWLNTNRDAFKITTERAEIDRLVNKILEDKKPMTREYFTQFQKQVDSFKCKSNSIDIRSLTKMYGSKIADAASVDACAAELEQEYVKSANSLKSLLKQIDSEEKRKKVQAEHWAAFYEDEGSLRQKLYAYVTEVVSLANCSSYLNGIFAAIDKKTVHVLCGVTPTNLNKCVKMVVKFLIPYAIDQERLFE